MKRTGRLLALDEPLLDVFSAGRRGPPERFSFGQLEQIRRTVRYVPEVMVKVTGGGSSECAVAAHVAYVGHSGEAQIESDRGDVIEPDEQKELLKSWNLDLVAGQYRASKGNQPVASRIKLVHNIVLGMPATTPPDKVLAAGRAFARKHFGAQHRYLVALHTHQKHPHVHLVVKAEHEFGGRRLHIDKAMLRQWRQDFAQLMREQGIAANATSRAVRGKIRRREQSGLYRLLVRDPQDSYTLQEKLDDVVRELRTAGKVRDPNRQKLLVTRNALISGWTAIAKALESQGDPDLAARVLAFTRSLAPVRTDRERLAEQLIDKAQSKQTRDREPRDRFRDRSLERTR